MSLIQQLVKKGLLEKEKATSLEQEIKSSGQREEKILIDKGVASESFLFELKSESLKIPLKDVSPEDVHLKVLELIPEDSAKYYSMIPLGKEDDVLEVGMVYPEDLKGQEALKFLARQGKFSFKVSLITFTTFNNILKQYRTLRKEVSRALEELETELKTERVGRAPKSSEEIERLVEEAPISKVVAVALKHAVEGGASDIHIEPTKEKLRIRFRVLGMLHSSIFLPMRIHPAVISRVKILSNLKIDETRIPQDGRFTANINNKVIDFRVSTFPTTLGEKIAIRVLDPSTGLKDFEELGLIGRNFKVAKEATEKPYGMILVTGPTGSGKTTTLYAVLQLLNKEGVNIITLEDPAEYFVEGINQSQIKPEIGYTFSTGLRHILRQDPDIIMVGEIRDEETANLAVHAALTGHIVLSTLHTSNVAGVVPRLIDLGVEPFLIAPSLGLALAQRLVRRLCYDCREKVEPSPKIKKMILSDISSLPSETKNEVLKDEKDIWVYEAKGCKKCNNEGYTGRVALFEVLGVTRELAEIISKEPSESKISEEAKRQGMSTMKQDGILKALQGITTIQEVLRVAEEK